MNHENRYGLLRKIFDAMPSMVFVVDDDVSIQEYNKTAADFLLMERPAILKHRGGEILHCIHATETKEGCGHAPFCKGCVIRNSVKSAFKGNRIVRARTRLEVLRGEDKAEIYALITASPFSYEDQQLVLLVIEDISVITEIQRMIPICSVCHKIRNEKEVWSQIEAYFKENWDVDFSHGLCPDCYRKEIDKLNKIG
ncbi:MAG: PAS domain-containing protein [Deltaproteobacteria bacterium]|jgi:PAS domain-containing protein|nr:PAS domain-containing protein [Deltaproteobacteria bacterium]